MKSKRPCLERRALTRQAGIGLIELLIGLGISLLLVLGVTILFLQQTRSYSTQDEMSQLIDSAAITAQVLSHGAQHAGYLGPSASSTVNSFGTATIVSGTNDDGANGSDSITFRYFGSVDSSGAVDNTVTDCHGMAPTSGMIIDTFHVAADPSNNNEPSLYCNNGVSDAVLVPGVESLQVLYGEDLTGAGAITRYVTSSVANMDQVRGLHISAVIRSPLDSHLAMEGALFNHFGQIYAPLDAAPIGDAGSVFTAASDKRIRRVIRFTVGIRNRLN